MRKGTTYVAILGITFLFTAIGIIGFRETSGLLLLAGALHLFGDGIPFLADAYNEYFVADERRSWQVKVGILGLNAAFLIFTSMLIAFEAADRWQSPYLVSKWVLLYAGFEVVGNLLQVRLAHPLQHMREHDEGNHIHDSNMGHLMGDVFASALQFIAAIAIATTGTLWIDSVASAIGTLFTLWLGIQSMFRCYRLYDLGPYTAHECCHHGHHH